MSSTDFGGRNDDLRYPMAATKGQVVDSKKGGCAQCFNCFIKCQGWACFISFLIMILAGIITGIVVAVRK